MVHPVPFQKQLFIEPTSHGSKPIEYRNVDGTESLTIKMSVLLEQIIKREASNVKLC